MRSALIGFFLLFVLVTESNAQMTFQTISEYCAAMAEAATPTLLARVNGISKQQAIQMMNGMTDPTSIRMVHEVLNYAYAKPPTATLDQMRSELRQLCIDRKIFVQ